MPKFSYKVTNSRNPFTAIKHVDDLPLTVPISIDTLIFIRHADDLTLVDSHTNI